MSRREDDCDEADDEDVPTIPNASEYVFLTREFQQLADGMALKASQKNIAGATLAYLRRTMNCVNCHNYVSRINKSSSNISRVFSRIVREQLCQGGE